MNICCICLIEITDWADTTSIVDEGGYATAHTKCLHNGAPPKAVEHKDQGGVA